MEGSSSYPDDGRREKDLRAGRTGEARRLIRGADAGDLGICKLHDGIGNECRDDGANDLTSVHGARGQLGVEAHLLVGNVVVSLAVDVVAKRLDKHEGLGVPRQSVADDQLGDDVEALGGS